MTTYPGRPLCIRPTARIATAGYTALLTICVVVSVGWLAIGGLVAVTAYSPGVAHLLIGQARDGSGWARGVLAALPRTEPLGQAVVDYGLSILNLALAGALIFLGLRTWVTQLFAVALIGSAGAFNLQAHAAAVAVREATGVDIGGLHQVLLHGVACAAYVVALLLLPAGRWESGPRSGTGRVALTGAGVGTLVLVGIGTTLLPHTASCILFFGFGVPLAGMAFLPSRIRLGATAELRTRARLLFSVLLAAFATCVVLAVVTLLLWYLGEPGLILVDPTAHSASLADGPAAGQPTALLFWFSRLSSAGIGAAVLVTIRRSRLWAAERLFSRGLASTMVIVLVGGGYVVVHSAVGWLPGTATGTGVVVATALATALASVTFLPLYLHSERLVERLLYGQRPTPYRVLADVAALSRTTSTEGPNLTGVAEAIGRALGARSCRLTVARPGLRDRTYAWSDGAGGDQDDIDQVVLPIRHGNERIGAIAVDRGAVAGLHNERRGLLEDVADSLGTIVQASRLGIELERQLRAALAHAEEIAVSRRLAVAERDSERRTIERDLHDGAQHHLVSLRLALGLVEHETSSGQFEQARARLAQLADQIGVAEAVLTKTATGVSSMVLAERGLVTALTSVLITENGAEPPIALRFGDTMAGRRYGHHVEAAVYFCCLEAVSNARKHAGGAAVSVWLEEVDHTLRFSVHDEGPGFDPAEQTGSHGRGMRNVVSRIVEVAGHVAVESTPGAGTTVHGWVPLPADPPTTPEPPPVPDPVAPPAAAAPVGNGDRSLIERARALVSAAGEIDLDDAARARLADLSDQFDQPLRVAVLGPAGSGRATLIRALAGHAGSPAPRLLDAEDLNRPDAPSVHATLLLIRGPDDDVPAVADTSTIGVLTRADECGGSEPDVLDHAARLADEYHADPTVGKRCLAVVPVAGLIAAGATTLNDDDFTSLRGLAELPPAEREDNLPPLLLARLGRFGTLAAVELIRTGTARTRDRLAEELVELSGLPRLHERLAWHVGRPAEAVKVRAVLRALEELLGPSGHRDPRVEALRYRVEHFRASAHELCEIDLVEALWAGSVRLPDADHELAERLLGANGTEATARVGLDSSATPDAILDAARHQLAHWQRLASHPAATTAIRDAAEVLARTCEELLTRCPVEASVGTADGVDPRTGHNAPPQWPRSLPDRAPPEWPEPAPPWPPLPAGSLTTTGPFPGGESGAGTGTGTGRGAGGCSPFPGVDLFPPSGGAGFELTGSVPAPGSGLPGSSFRWSGLRCSDTAGSVLPRSSLP